MSLSPDRQAAFAALGSQQFDLAIIGGGITGCGIARDAALRGLTVALIEKLDFAAGTSSKSSKLVHGGLRYLEQGELKLVFESVNERNLLMKLARHLVRPTAFLVTNFKRDPRWLLTLDLGLWLYEALCLFGGYKNHRTYRAAKTRELEPGLLADGLSGGIVYYDCMTDDARLTLENAIDARDLGAVVVNHARAGELLREGEKVVGVTVHDELDGERAVSTQVRARVVINATGPWSDEVRALAKEKSILKPTKGVHIVVDSARLPVRHALLLLSPRDQRALFAIPWGLGRSVIGTTDTFFDGQPDEVHATADDVEYLLESGNHYFPDAKLTADDVLSTWAGLRPLLKPPDSQTGASQVSREHLIDQHDGFITIAGGKLTTYRRMAAEVVDVAMLQLKQRVRCTTDDRPLPGAMGVDSDEALFATAATLGLETKVAEALVGIYGTRARSVADRTVSDESAKTPIDPELPFIAAQVDEAIDRELAVTLDDVLTRRIPLVLRARDQGEGIADFVAQRMAKRLGWSGERTQRELAAYRSVIEKSRRFRTG